MARRVRSILAMRNAIRIGRLFGIDLKVDSSWLFIFALVIWSLASLFASWHPAWSVPVRVAVALAAALAFFASILAHEMAHSLVARLYGISVRDITLHMFGGVSNIEREPAKPAAEFLIAVVGPISSVLLGIGMLIAASAVTGVLTPTTTGLSTASDIAASMGPLTTLLVWLGPVNIMIGVFNLVPGFPLDGGRILRSLLWLATGNLQKATRWATTVGQFIGWAFIVTGLFMAFGHHVPFLGRGLVSGLWLGLIGLFLRNAASAHQAGAVVESSLAGMRVSDVMRTNGPWISADVTVRSVLGEWFMREGNEAFPVFADGRFVGLVSLEDVRKVPVEEWDARRVEGVMIGRERLETVAPHDDAFTAVKRMGSLLQVPVVAGDTLVGMVHARDLERWLELRRPDGGASAPPVSRRHRHV